MLKANCHGRLKRPRMRYQVAAAGRTHPGRVRENNEDTLYVVASGPSEDVYHSLTEAVERGSRAIARQVQKDPSLAGMSTTVTVIVADITAP